MAKTAPTPVTITIPGRGVSLPPGGQVSLLQKGTAIYEAARINGDVTIKTDTATVTASVQAFQVGALIDLLPNYGPQSVHTYGRPYSALGLIQALTDASDDDVLDVTKLYTAVVVTVPMPVMQMP